MNDKDILLRLMQQAYSDDALTQTARKEYEKLVNRFDEDGMELEFPVIDLDEHLENALQNLHETGYTIQALRYHGPTDGHSLHVNLRGEKFQKIAINNHSVVGMNDSGKRETFATGAVRDSAEGKPRPELISPFAMERLAEWLRKGAEKYAPRNWEAGIPLSRCTASLCRHLLKFQQGATDEDHVAAILCNAMFIAHIQEMCNRGVLPESLLDMPKYEA